MSTLPLPIVEKVKPRLRGVSHVFGFAAAVGGLVFLAMAPAEGFQYLSGVLYGLSLCLMFGLSGLYHRPNWSHAARMRLRKLDHAGIYGLIAGTTTPLAVMRAHGAWSTLLTVMWVVAILGMVFVVGWSHAPRALRAGLYVGVGIVGAPVLFGLSNVIGAGRVAGLVAGAVVYIAGAGVYARRWPNPRPSVFGYHEVFHVMVIIAAALHYGVVVDLQYRGA